MKAKLKSSEATKKLYWKRKKENSKMNNHEKRVAVWKAKVSRFQDDLRPLIAGASPVPKNDRSLLWV